MPCAPWPDDLNAIDQSGRNGTVSRYQHRDDGNIRAGRVVGPEVSRISEYLVQSGLRGANRALNLQDNNRSAAQHNNVWPAEVPRQIKFEYRVVAICAWILALDVVVGALEPGN